MNAARIATAAFATVPTLVWGHAFDERYDLPAPLSYFIAGATAAVALSFIIAILFVRETKSASATTGRVFTLGPLLPLLQIAGTALSLLIFTLVIVAGLYGTSDPLMNVAPTLVWVLWWVGLSLLVACVGNIWPAIDPWRILFDALDALARRLGCTPGISLHYPWPDGAGSWPAVLLLLALGWFELVYPQAAIPYKLACVLLGWSAFTLAGMILFGREVWQQHVDVFSVYFALLGRCAPLASGPDLRSIVVRAPGSDLITGEHASFATVAFVIAMLSIVLFDGLLVGDLWPIVQQGLARTFPPLADSHGHIFGITGLIGLWLLFLAAYLMTCFITHCLVAEYSTLRIARLFTLTLLPIAVGYNIAHNAATLVMQLQLLIPLASDPLGLQWNLFGTVHYKPEIGLIDAQACWFIAVVAIVGGHVISIWLAHRVALRSFGNRQRAVTAAIPLASLMVLYTSISLSVIAEPLVTFTPPGVERTVED